MGFRRELKLRVLRHCCHFCLYQMFRLLLNIPSKFGARCKFFPERAASTSGKPLWITRKYLILNHNGILFLKVYFTKSHLKSTTIQISLQNIPSLSKPLFFLQEKKLIVQNIRVKEFLCKKRWTSRSVFYKFSITPFLFRAVTWTFYFLFFFCRWWFRIRFNFKSSTQITWGWHDVLFLVNRANSILNSVIWK